MITSWRRLFSQISNFGRRECELLAPSDQELASIVEQPDTTMKLKCNSVVLDKFDANKMLGAMKYWPEDFYH